MTGEPSSEITGDSRRRRHLSSEATTSQALEQTQIFARRALLLSLGCALLLAFSMALASAASAKTSAAKISARLTATEFVASQVKSVKLVYKLPASSKSFSYRLTLKQGATWKPISSATKGVNSTSRKRLTVNKLFGRGTIRVGLYRVQLSCAGASKSLSFRISPFYGRLTKKSFTIAEAKSIKLTYGFSKPSKSFAYKLSAKKSSGWKLIKSAKTIKKSKRSYFIGVKTASLKKLFGGKAFALGLYRFKISSAYSTRQLNFKIVKSANPATSTGGSGTGSGSGSGSTGSANFTISGGVSGLEPGLTLPVRLTLTNPHSIKIYVTRLTISMSADSTPSGCSRDTNFEITQSNASSSDPIPVPAKGKVTLTSAPRAPQITFHNLSTSQDVCKGKSFALTFSGSAHS
jgi:hypothetical protein